MIQRKPLIYIPSKKKKVTSSPTPVVESSVGMWVDTQYINNYFNSGTIPTQQSLHPHMIYLSPYFINFYMTGKHIGRVSDLKARSNFIIPIVAHSSTTLTQSAVAMRWAPLPVTKWTASVSLSGFTCFYICSGYNDIVKFTDSNRVEPAVLPISVTSEAIPNTSNPVFRLEKFVDTNIVSQIQSLLASENIPTTGALFCSNRDFSVWDNQTLLDYSQYMLGDYYGRKTGVYTIDNHFT